MKIVFDNVTKNFGPITALKNLTFEIDSGEFVFLIGPSGSGKSTILKLILHQYHPTVGKILINDTNLGTCPRKEIDKIRRQIGVIFQDYQLISDKTIEENITLALDIVNYPSLKIPLKVDQVLEQVGLSSRRFLFPSQLSGGELQRASLARAIAVDPKIILADEPTGNLDPENATKLVNLLNDINKTLNATILMTSHNMEIVRSVHKRIIEIAHGQLIVPKSKK